MHYTADWTELAAGVRKYVHRWEPDDGTEPAALICIVHGLGEHGGRYHRLAAELVAAGFVVLAFDQTGHGRCSAPRGSIHSYSALLSDIGAMLGWTTRTYAELPRVLLGHSMGGNLVLNYVMRNADSKTAHLPQAVISSSPMIRSSREPGWFFERIARIGLRIAPNLCLKSHVVAERLMSDRNEQHDFDEDELFHKCLSLRLGAGLLDSGRWLLKNASLLRVPTLLTHGTNDYLTSPVASTEFANLTGDICQLCLLEGHLHDTFRDVGREEVIDRFIQFSRSFVRQTVK
ncbi:MAG: alpha/beta hydrolase [Pirellulaceae bacterium]